jgi:hypothetical protein
LNDNLHIVKEFHEYSLTENPDKILSPFMSIRYCLYLYDPEVFERILFKKTRGRFIEWLDETQIKSV